LQTKLQILKKKCRDSVSASKRWTKTATPPQFRSFARRAKNISRRTQAAPARSRPTHVFRSPNRNQKFQADYLAG
jgi:hypothetical protein